MPFNIEAEIASPFESYSGLNGKIRRKIDRYFSKSKDYENRYYLKQNNREFDSRFHNITIQQKLYLDGYWQSEKYFFDIKDQIRKDFMIKTKLDQTIIKTRKEIISSNSVFMHVRKFDSDPNNTNAHGFTLSTDYYLNAVAEIIDKVDDPLFIIFGQQDNSLINKIDGLYNYIIIEDNKDYEDLYLMSQCKHAIISNSSFAWWGAWLIENSQKIVLTSDPEKYSINKDYYPINKNYKIIHKNH